MLFAAFFVFFAASADARVVTADIGRRFSAVTAHDVPREEIVGFIGVFKEHFV